MLCKAHKNNIRIVYGTAYPVDKLHNATMRREWIQNWIVKLKNTYADGLNIDIEDVVAKDSQMARDMVTLLKEIREALAAEIPGSQLTFDVAWSPNCIDGRCYDWKGIADNTEFMIMMDYDLRSQIFGPCIARYLIFHSFLLKILFEDFQMYSSLIV